MNGQATRKHVDHGKTRWWMSPFGGTGSIRHQSDPEILPSPPTQRMRESPDSRGIVEMPANESVVGPSAHLELPSKQRHSQQPPAQHNPMAFAQANNTFPRHSTLSTFSTVSAMEQPDLPQRSGQAADISPQDSTLLGSAPELRAQVVQIGSWPNSPNAPPFAVIDASAGALHVPDSPSSRLSLTTCDMYGRILGGHTLRSSYASSGTEGQEGMIPMGASKSPTEMQSAQQVFELPADGEFPPMELPGTPVEPWKT
jgi:hypothetical protein